jgi:hypothetical protein
MPKVHLPPRIRAGIFGGPNGFNGLGLLPVIHIIRLNHLQGDSFSRETT